MKFLIIISIFAFSAYKSADATAAAIVAAARSQIGVPYVYGGGNYNGKSSSSFASGVGFDCSGLSQYAVYHGTGKILTRTASTQYNDAHCHHVAYGSHAAGDLVFFSSGGSISHVAVVSGATTMIHAPHTGDHVREATIYSAGRMAYVQRCF